MRLLSKKEIQHLTFPDASVEKFQLDLQNKKLEITTNISHIGGSTSELCGNTFIIIYNWKEIIIKEWDGHSYNILKSNFGKVQLKDICENSFGKEIIMKGFTRETDFWTEFQIIEGDITVETES